MGPRKLNLAPGVEHFVVVSKRRIFSLFSNRVRIGRSRSSKVDNFGTNRKRICGEFHIFGSETRKAREPNEGCAVELKVQCK